ncbi:SHOCT domain-containing protein [Massilia sp. X63]|uniref:SHOCT domain-containing protein n=1 Tax=Massilia sp. X63 TaxID=3237285 RepID=UPI0034DDB720
MEWILGVLFVLIIIAGIVVGLNNEKTLEALKASLQSRTDFTLSQHVVGCDLKTGIALDESRGKLCLMTRSGDQFTLRMIEMRDIVSAELFEDGDSVTKTMRSSQLGGALIGGLAFGGVGALVGGLSGKTRTATKIKQIALRIVANDPSSPLHDITFMNTDQKKDGFVYRAAMQNARHWHGILEILIKRADTEMKSSQPAAAIPQATPAAALDGSVADELEKLASLRTAGILTDDEFNTQKSKLLARA